MENISQFLKKTKTKLPLVVVQLLSHARLFATPKNCSTPGFPILHYLPKIAQIHDHWLSRWCHPTISSCRSLLLLPSVFPSTRVFSNESGLCIRRPKYLSTPLLHIYPQSWKQVFKYLYMDLCKVQSTNVQTTKTAVQHWMDKQNAVLLIRRNQAPLGLTDTHHYV